MALPLGCGGRWSSRTRIERGSGAWPFLSAVLTGWSGRTRFERGSGLWPFLSAVVNGWSSRTRIDRGSGVRPARTARHVTRRHSPPNYGSTDFGPSAVPRSVALATPPSPNQTRAPLGQSSAALVTGVWLRAGGRLLEALFGTGPSPGEKGSGLAFPEISDFFIASVDTGCTFSLVVAGTGPAAGAGQTFRKEGAQSYRAFPAWRDGSQLPR